MQITKQDFGKITEYIKNELLKQLLPAIYDNGYPLDGVPKATILSIPQLITLEGFLQATGEKKERKTKTPVEDDKGFAEFWSTYPASANFTYKGMKFKSDRALRSNYQVCQNKYLKALEQYNITPVEIMKALTTQLSLSKNESYNTGTNKLQYWSGIEVYLNTAKFMAFIGEGNDDLVLENEDIEQSNCA